MKRVQRGLAAVLLGVTTLAPVVGFAEPAHAAAIPDPCEIVEDGVARLVIDIRITASEQAGPDGPECVLEIANQVAVAFDARDGGHAAFADLESNYGNTERLEDLGDEAIFGWEDGVGLDLVARLGSRVVLLQLTGAYTALGFSDTDPASSRTDDGSFTGSPAGIALWALAADALFTLDDSVAPSALDLDGLWVTSDIDGCLPRPDLTARLVEVEVDGDQIRLTKRAGDPCLDDGGVDFEGTMQARSANGTGDRSDLNFAPGPGPSPATLNVTTPGQMLLAFDLPPNRVYRRVSVDGGGSSAAEPSALLGIPTPSDAVTAKNVFLSTLIALLLFAMVMFPSSLFNHTLEANIEHYRGVLERVRRRLKRDQPHPKRALWTRWAGVAIYVAVAALLYSVIQPEWGLNRDTVNTVLGFAGAMMITTGLSVLVSRTFVAIRYRTSGGHPHVEPSTLVIAIVCAAASRAVAFVPGYLYGVLARYEPQRPPDESDRGPIIMLTGTLFLAVGVVSWFMVPALDKSSLPLLERLPRALAGGVFVTCVEALVIGLLPLRFLPGDVLYRHNARAWAALWGGGAFLFSLVLLRPGLVSGHSDDVVNTLVLIGCFNAFSIAFWFFHRQRATRATI